MPQTLISEINPTLEIDYLKLQKMTFIFNAIQSGWKVEKREGQYIFTKPHEGKKEVFLDSYLKRFIEANLDINHLIK